METRYYEAAMRIDHEMVKTRALTLRNEAIESTWAQLVRKVSGWMDGLGLDAKSPSGDPGVAHFGQTRHRSG